MKFKRSAGGLWIICAMAAILLTACTSTLEKRKPESTPPPPPKPQEPVPVYLDFDDVLIPSELSLDRNNSFIYTAAGQTAGIMALDGRVEIGSLIDFFQGNMAKDNWELISSIKSARTMMLYKKAQRWCVIGISAEEMFTNHVEIWVAPTAPPQGYGLMK